MGAFTPFWTGQKEFGDEGGRHVLWDFFERGPGCDEGVEALA